MVFVNLHFEEGWFFIKSSVDFKWLEDYKVIDALERKVGAKEKWILAGKQFRSSKMLGSVR